MIIYTVNNGTIHTLTHNISKNMNINLLLGKGFYGSFDHAAIAASLDKLQYKSSDYKSIINKLRIMIFNRKIMPIHRNYQNDSYIPLRYRNVIVNPLGLILPNLDHRFPKIMDQYRLDIRLVSSLFDSDAKKVWLDTYPKLAHHYNQFVCAVIMIELVWGISDNFGVWSEMHTVLDVPNPSTDLMRDWAIKFYELMGEKAYSHLAQLLAAVNINIIDIKEAAETLVRQINQFTPIETKEITMNAPTEIALKKIGSSVLAVRGKYVGVCTVESINVNITKQGTNVQYTLYIDSKLDQLNQRFNIPADKVFDLSDTAGAFRSIEMETTANQG